MIRYLVRDLKLRSRKGNSKPIYMVAAITLAILFVVAYYTATTGWLNDLGGNFAELVNSKQSSVENAMGS